MSQLQMCCNLQQSSMLRYRLYDKGQMCGKCSVVAVLTRLDCINVLCSPCMATTEAVSGARTVVDLRMSSV